MKHRATIEGSMRMATTDSGAILASWKISEVLKRHPELLDELVGLSPAFEKLRNPVMRASRAVGEPPMAQAAGIAGLDPARSPGRSTGGRHHTAREDAGRLDSRGTGRQAGWVASTPVATELEPAR